MYPSPSARLNNIFSKNFFFPTAAKLSRSRKHYKVAAHRESYMMNFTPYTNQNSVGFLQKTLRTKFVAPTCHYFHSQINTRTSLTIHAHYLLLIPRPRAIKPIPATPKAKQIATHCACTRSASIIAISAATKLSGFACPN